jgi:SAM-dependent methyltransferase
MNYVVGSADNPAVSLSSPRANGDPNLHVYDTEATAEHYASLNYLTDCERLLFDTFIQPGARVLDLGVGAGRTTAYLSNRASRYFAVDYAEQMIRKCRQRYPNIDLAVMDVIDLSPIPSDSFDVAVFAFNGIDNVFPDENRLRFLQECRRVLVTGGIFIFSAHNPRAVLVRSRWSPERLRSFVRQRVPEGSSWFSLSFALATCAAAVVNTGRAIASSLWRLSSRIPARAFWRGEGWFRDPSHGGLLNHYAIPKKITAELEANGFHLVRILGDDYPLKSQPLVTNWYYYVFSKHDR